MKVPEPSHTERFDIRNLKSRDEIERFTDVPFTIVSADGHAMPPARDNRPTRHRLPKLSRSVHIGPPVASDHLGADTREQSIDGAGRLRVSKVDFAVRTNALLNGVSFSAGRGSLTAIIGPSGAGKSTLVKLVAGITRPTAGVVTFDGHNLHAKYGSLRHRIGLVPQENIIHLQLTVAEALGYVAELRLPRATDQTRREAVEDVISELDLTKCRNTRVDKLSGGERKRASVAMELLTGPSLLILDEPTSGLDPALDRQVMNLTRRLADAGRVVLVVTHCLSNLDVCDQVLFLTPGGKTAYFGPPDQICKVMGTANWADIFARVGMEPEVVNREFLARLCTSGQDTAHPSPPRTPPPCPPKCRRRQFLTLSRRQLRLLVADRGYFTFLLVLPFILGALALLVPGHAGLGVANPLGPVPDEPAQILMLLNISAVFMGTALTIRDLVGERAIFRREQLVGLSASAYLLAKIGVYGVASTVQTAILVAIVLIGKGGPTQGAVVLGNSAAELYITLAVTALIAAVNGMALSAAARSQDEILPMLVISVMLSIVLAGGLIPVTGRLVLNQVSWALPARWGFAASASTVDLRHIATLVPANETLWTHDPTWWLLDMLFLVLLGVATAGFLRWCIRLKSEWAPRSRGRHRPCRR
ncbi:MAG: transport system ATP-binding/permease protein [Mycobacterium sp.]|jgi:ABC-type multidrug transport system ATPase subunit|nr:transport system ATP-binding/permease protein [Mycobacterium sp.]